MTLDQIAEKLIIISDTEQEFINQLQGIGLECASTPFCTSQYNPIQLLIDIYGLTEDQQNYMWDDIVMLEPPSMARRVYDWILANIK